MPFTTTNTFAPDGKGISAEVNQNFADIVKELNAFPTNGAWKGINIFTTDHFRDGSLGGQVLSNAFQFVQVPKGPAGIDPTHSDHFAPKRFVDNLKASLLLPSAATMNTGEDAIDTVIAEYDQVFTFGNKMMLEVGCKLCDSNESTAHTIDVDLVAGFEKIIFPFGTLLSKAPTGGNATAHVTIGARSKVTFSLNDQPQSNYYGILYFIVGSGI
jgi:hypothetical protein